MYAPLLWILCDVHQWMLQEIKHIKSITTIITLIHIFFWIFFSVIISFSSYLVWVLTLKQKYHFIIIFASHERIATGKLKVVVIANIYEGTGKF